LCIKIESFISKFDSKNRRKEKKKKEKKYKIQTKIGEVTGIINTKFTSVRSSVFGVRPANIKADPSIGKRKKKKKSKQNFLF
jgi:hypothetical protein